MNFRLQNKLNDIQVAVILNTNIDSQAKSIREI